MNISVETSKEIVKSCCLRYVLGVLLEYQFAPMIGAFFCMVVNVSFYLFIFCSIPETLHRHFDEMTMIRYFSHSD